VDTATTYQYDGLGNRIGMTHNGVESAYLLDPSGVAKHQLRNKIVVQLDRPKMLEDV